MKAYRTFGQVPDNELLTLQDLAFLFQRHEGSILRATKRGDLPPGVKILGKPRWLASDLRAHFKAMAARANDQKGRSDARLQRVQ